LTGTHLLVSLCQNPANRAEEDKIQYKKKNEEIEVLVTPWEEAIKLHNEGIIKDMASVTALLLTKNYLKL